MDRRLRKTEEAIQNALIELVSKNGYENVKMIDVIAKADINKSTFYSHHQSLLGVSFAIEDKLITGILDVLHSGLTLVDALVENCLITIKSNRKAWQTVLSVSEGHFYKKLEITLDEYLSKFIVNKGDKESVKYKKSALFGALFGVARAYALGSNRSDIKKAQLIILETLKTSD